MAQTIGEWIRQARQKHGLSQNKLALRGRVAPSTLNRWERGITRPSIYELEQVLQALDISPQGRLEAIRLLDAPRALWTLQQISRQQPHPSGELTPPLLGDLLGALRRRCGWRVNQVASALKVSERTVRGWERSEIIPSDEHLHALCYVLQATADEVAFILTRPLWLQPPSISSHLEEANLLKERIDQTRQMIWQGTTVGMELHLLGLEAQAWWLVRRCPHRTELLREVYTLCCQWFSLNGRPQDAERYGYLGLRLLRNESRFPRSAAWLIRSIAVYNTEPNRNKARLIEAVDVLRDWLPQVSQSVEHEAWFYREMSELYSEAQRYEEAFQTAEQAYQIIQRSDSLIEHQHARISRSLVLARIGQPHKALEILTPPEQPFPTTEATYLLVLYEVYSAMNELEQAICALTKAEEIAREHHVQSLLHTIERLQRARSERV